MYNKNRIVRILLSSAIVFTITTATIRTAYADRIRRHAPEASVQQPEIEARIVGGVPTSIDRYPTIVLLSDEYGNSNCAGSLILPNVVLTAAHCADHVEIAQVGVNNRLDAFTSPAVETYSIQKKIVHPMYGAKVERDCDYLLLKLSGSSTVSPVTLNDNTDLPSVDSQVTAVGWGAEREGSVMSLTLNQVTVKVVSERECYHIYDVALSQNMVCASAPGKDACQGDSGGPLYVLGPTSDTDTLIGLVSWGVGCAEANFPGVYSRIASPDALSWLKKEACRLSGIKPCKLSLSSNYNNQLMPSLTTTALATSTTPISTDNTIVSLKDTKNCRDASSFVGVHGILRNCSWVDDQDTQKRGRRCQFYNKKCPQVCKDLYPSIKLC